MVPDDVRFTDCILVPTYDEDTDFLSRLETSSLLNNIPPEKNTLIILVINQPESITLSPRNQGLWDYGFKSGELIAKSKQACLIRWLTCQGYLLIIDCFSEGKRIPVNHGVGLARKIACDTACALIEKNQLTNPWLYNTDADAILPDNYFSSRFLKDKFSAILFSYYHIASPCDEENNVYSADKIYNATKVVEHSLQYYVDGLRYANSPYAYHSLGSCMCVHAHYYAQVRGFPKRAGGEDFYLLNKLNKLRPLITDDNICIELQSRASKRVPFGTGPAVAAVLEADFSAANYPYYHPGVFLALKNLLHFFKELAQPKASDKNGLQQLSNETQQALTSIGFDKFFHHLNKHAGHDNKQRLKAINDWFDAFKTLKFIHAMEKANPRAFTKIGLDKGLEKLEKLIREKDAR